MVSVASLSDGVQPRKVAQPSAAQVHSPAPGADLLPLIVGVPRRAPTQPAGSLRDTEVPQGLRKKVLERDGGRCRFCGVALPEHLEIAHQDDDHSNHRVENLATACRWCHGVQHLGDRGRAGLVVLAIHPEWPAKDLPPQWQIHHLMRAMIVAPEEAVIPVQLLSNFLYEDCVDAVAAWLPSKDPTWLAERLSELSDEEYRQREYLSGFRVLPASDPPPQPGEAVVEAWRHENVVRAYWSSELERRVAGYWIHPDLESRGGGS